MLKDVAAKRIAAWLEHGPQTASAVASAESAKRFGDRCWVMREIVDDSDAIHLGLHLETALHGLKTLERLGDGARLDAVVRSHGSSCRRIEHVVFTGQRKGEMRPRLVVAQEPPTGLVRLEIHVGDAPVGAVLETVTLDLAKCSAHAVVDVAAGVPGDEAAALR